MLGAQSCSQHCRRDPTRAEQRGNLLPPPAAAGSCGAAQDVLILLEDELLLSLFAEVLNDPISASLIITHQFSGGTCSKAQNDIREKNPPL